MKKFKIKSGKWLFLALIPAVALWFAFFGMRRTRILVKNEKGQILLLKSWFGRQKWGTPGGGVKSTESPKRAALRELHEETGILVDSESLKFVTQTWMGEPPLRYMGYIFTLDIDAETAVAPQERFNHEIIAFKWFDVGKLPKNIKDRYDEFL